MYDTVLNDKIQRLGDMAEELAADKLDRSMPGWKRDRLVREFRKLNGEIAPEQDPPRHTARTARPSLLDHIKSWWIGLKLWWVEYIEADEKRRVMGIICVGLLAVILVALVGTAIGYALGFAAS